MTSSGIAQADDSTQPARAAADNPAMTWWNLGPGCGVLELDYISPNPPSIAVGKPEALDVELRVYWGGGEPTRAVWLWSQTGTVAGWSGVGEA